MPLILRHLLHQCCLNLIDSDNGTNRKLPCQLDIAPPAPLNYGERTQSEGWS